MQDDIHQLLKLEEDKQSKHWEWDSYLKITTSMYDYLYAYMCTYSCINVYFFGRLHSEACFEI